MPYTEAFQTVRFLFAVYYSYSTWPRMFRPLLGLYSILSLDLRTHTHQEAGLLLRTSNGRRFFCSFASYTHARYASNVDRCRRRRLDGTGISLGRGRRQVSGKWGEAWDIKARALVRPRNYPVNERTNEGSTHCTLSLDPLLLGADNAPASAASFAAAAVAGTFFPLSRPRPGLCAHKSTRALSLSTCRYCLM